MSHIRTGLMLVAAVGCGGGDGGPAFEPNHIEDPQPHEGGGLGSGAILGELNVFVIDGRTDQVVSGADVYLGAGDTKERVVGRTNADGLVIFRENPGSEDTDVVEAPEDSLAGPQIVTAIAEDYAATTWFGVNGAVVTLPIEPAQPEDDDEFDMATVTGTIAGWDNLPDPPMGRFLVAFVNYTARGDLDAPENAIAQAIHTDPILNAIGIPQNTCARGMLSPVLPFDSCDWTLATRTGPQAIYAGLLTIDPMAADLDPQPLGFAAKTGFDLAADDVEANVALDIVDSSDLADLEVVLEDPPSGLSEVATTAVLDLGDEGQLVVPVPATLASIPVPKPTGDLDGEYVIYSSAKSDPAEDHPVSLIAERDADVDGEVQMGEWLDVPDDIDEDLVAIPNTYRFGRVDGADVHAVAFDDTDGTHAWNVLFLEPPSTGEAPDAGVEPSLVFSFALPILPEDPLPKGNVDFTVSAFELPSFDPLDFVLDSLEDTIQQWSVDQDTFRRE